MLSDKFTFTSRAELEQYLIAPWSSLLLFSLEVTQVHKLCMFLAYSVLAKPAIKCMAHNVRRPKSEKHSMSLESLAKRIFSVSEQLV